MIACYWPKCRNPDGAVMSIGVKRGDRVLSVVLACAGHVPTAMHDGLALAQEKGGRVASVSLHPPARSEDPDPLVNAGIVIPRSEHRAMVLAAQTLGMSQREFTRAAINNQVVMVNLMRGGGDDGTQ